MTLLGRVSSSTAVTDTWTERPAGHPEAIQWVTDPVRANAPKVLKFRVEKGWEWSGDDGRSPAKNRAEAKIASRYGFSAWAPQSDSTTYYEVMGYYWPADQAWPQEGSGGYGPIVAQTNVAPGYTKHYHGNRFKTESTANHVRFGNDNSASPGWPALTKQEWLDNRGKWIHALTKIYYGTTDTTGKEQTTLYLNGVKWKTGPELTRSQMGADDESGIYRKFGIYRTEPTRTTHGADPFVQYMDYAWADTFADAEKVITDSFAGGTTAPEETSGDVVLWAVGDGDDSTASKNVVSMIMTDGLDAFEKLLYLGDVYPDGSSSDWSNNFLTDGAGNTVWGAIPETQRFHTPGNHELERGYPGEYDKRTPSSHSADGKRYHEITLSNGWKVITLNSSADTTGGGNTGLGETSPDFDFLQTRLNATAGTAKIVIWHKPAYTGGSHGDKTAMQKFYKACAGKAALIFCGHDHDFQLFRPHNGTDWVTPTSTTVNSADEDGVTGVIAGNGGHDLRSVSSRTGQEWKLGSTAGACRVTLSTAAGSTATSAYVEFLSASTGGASTLQKTKTVTATLPTATAPDSGGTSTPTTADARYLDVTFNASTEPQVAAVAGSYQIASGAMQQTVSSTAPVSDVRVTQPVVVAGRSVATAGTLAHIASGTGDLQDTLDLIIDEVAGDRVTFRRHYNNTGTLLDVLEFRLVVGHHDAAQRSYPITPGAAGSVVAAGETLKGIAIGVGADGKTVMPLISVTADPDNPIAATWRELGDPVNRRAFTTAYLLNPVTVRRSVMIGGTGTASTSVTGRLYGRTSPFGGPPPTVVTSETQTVTIIGATGGTFALVYPVSTESSQTTAAIAFNATAATVQSALEALTAIGTGNVTVTGATGGTSTPSGPFTVTFGGALAGKNMEQLQGDATLLTPAGSGVDVVTTKQGAQIAYPGNTVRRFDGVDDRLAFPVPGGATGQVAPAFVSTAVEEFGASATAQTVAITGTSGQAEVHVIVDSKDDVAALSAQTYETQGWTKMQPDLGGTGADHHTVMFGKVLTATETAPTFTLSASVPSQVIKLVVSGQVGLPTGTAVSSKATNVNQTSAPGSAVTAGSDNSLLVSLVSVDASDADPSPFFTPPTGMTERLDFKGRTTSATPAGDSLQAGAATQGVSAGSYTPSWTLADADNSHVYNFVFSPPAGTGGSVGAAGVTEPVVVVALFDHTADQTDDIASLAASTTSGAEGRRFQVAANAGNTANPGQAIYRDTEKASNAGSSRATVPLNEFAVVVWQKDAAGKVATSVYRSSTQTWLHSDVPDDGSNVLHPIGATIPAAGRFYVGVGHSGGGSIASMDLAAIGWARGKQLSPTDREEFVSPAATVTRTRAISVLSRGVSVAGEDAHWYEPASGALVGDQITDRIGTLHEVLAERVGSTYETRTNQVPIEAGIAIVVDQATVISDPTGFVAVDASIAIDATDTSLANVPTYWDAPPALPSPQPAGTTYVLPTSWGVLAADVDESGHLGQYREIKSTTTQPTSAAPLTVQVPVGRITALVVVARTSTVQSGRSNEEQVTVAAPTATADPVTAVTGVAATASGGTITVTWTPNPAGEQIDGYAVELRKSTDAWLDPPVPSYNGPGIPIADGKLSSGALSVDQAGNAIVNGISYTIRVRAYQV